MMVIEPLFFLLLYGLVFTMGFHGGRMYQWVSTKEGEPIGEKPVILHKKKKMGRIGRPFEEKKEIPSIFDEEIGL